MIIGFAGPARAGKDTSADFIISENPEWVKMSLADPMKEMLKVGLGLSDDQLWGDKKDIIDPRYGTTPRFLMQTLATEWGRNTISYDIWVKAMEAKIGDKNVIIPDIRFENEASLVRKYGVLIHIKGRGGIDTDHISEKSLHVSPFSDFILYNNWDLEILNKNVLSLFHIIFP